MGYVTLGRDPMQDMILAICNHYAKDPTAPNVVLSHVPTKGFYCSIARYLAPRAGYKQVVCSAFGDTVENAITACFIKWQEIAQ